MSRDIQFKIPAKLKELDKSTNRYKGAKGGRGSAKSWFFADRLIERFVDNQNLNWACMREIQKSIAKSSKKLLEDRIEFYGLHDYFEILQTEIRAKRGNGVIIFQGLQDHTADSIKSLEGFDGCWIEEAQTITQHSLDLLTPTFRKEGSEIWFSWNPRLRTDAVERLFKSKDNSILTHINYLENPFCPTIIKDEAKEMQLKDPDKYHHIYLGGYLDTTGNKLFSYKDLDRAMTRKVKASGATIIGCDVARYGSDSSVLCIRAGLWVKAILQKTKLDITQVSDWVKTVSNVYQADAIITDTIGLGVGVHDILLRSGYFGIDGNFSKSAQKDKIYHNKRAESYFKLSEAVKRGLAMPENEDLMEELLSISYEFTGTGRIKITEKDKIKEELGRSPDLADALALTYFTDVMAMESKESMGYGEPDVVNPNLF